MTTTLKLPPYVQYIVDAISARRGVLVSDVLGPCRTRPTSWARYEIWATLVRGRREGFDLHNPFSAMAVARMFGRDHSSIQHGVRRFTDRPPIPSKRGRALTTSQDPCPPAGHCLPPTPRQDPTPVPRLRRQVAVPPPRTPEEIRAERNRRRREADAKRRPPRPIGADDRFWLRSLGEQRAGAGHEHV